MQRAAIGWILAVWAFGGLVIFTFISLAPPYQVHPLRDAHLDLYHAHGRCLNQVRDSLMLGHTTIMSSLKFNDVMARLAACEKGQVTSPRILTKGDVDVAMRAHVEAQMRCGGVPCRPGR